MSPIFVVVMGLCTVFFGLVCIVGLCSLMNLICDKFLNKSKSNGQINNKKNTPDTLDESSQIDHKTLVVLCAAAIAEEMQTDVSALRIVSIKKM